MLLTIFKSKIHCATITEANLAYVGSITIDEALLEASGIIEGERVQVVNNNTLLKEKSSLRNKDSCHRSPCLSFFVGRTSITQIRQRGPEAPLQTEYTLR